MKASVKPVPKVEKKGKWKPKSSKGYG